MPSLKHTHSYERVGSRASSKLWRCTHPQCTHVIKQEFIIGKMSKCDCGVEFLLDSGAFQRKKPKCLNCRNTKEGRQHQKVLSVIESLLPPELLTPHNNDNEKGEAP